MVLCDGVGPIVAGSLRKTSRQAAGPEHLTALERAGLLLKRACMQGLIDVVMRNSAARPGVGLGQGCDFCKTPMGGEDSAGAGAKQRLTTEIRNIFSL